MSQIPAMPPLPGAIGLTHLKVYDTPAPDGLVGGSPHVHFACTEAYFISAGHGVVQTLGAEGYRELTLEPGKLVWFTPGVIHRLINEDGQLEIVIPMQNAGLPEAGDFVLTFPPEVLADETAYFEAASLAASGHVYTDGMAAATRRRDLAVEGFLRLRQEFDRDGTAALQRFYSMAVRLVQPKIASWRDKWAQGPLKEVERTRTQFAALERGDASHLMQGQVNELTAADPRKLGMCGTLGVYQLEGVRK